MYVLKSSKDNPHAANILELQKMQLRGYLRQFAVKPNKDPELWRLARELMADRQLPCISLRFADEREYREFGQVLLLSQAKQMSWYETDAYSLQAAWFGDITVGIPDYLFCDVMFVVIQPGHSRLALLSDMVGKISCLMPLPKRLVVAFLGNANESDVHVPPRTLKQVSEGVRSAVKIPKVFAPKREMVGGEVATSAVTSNGTPPTGGYAV